MGTPRHFEPTPQEAPIHDSVFGHLNEQDQLADDTPAGADPDSVNIIGAAVQPERNQPIRNLGDTDQGDRQPDGRRRR
ncbi:MAG: hypothetical protein Q8R02_04405 [Hyphomonadaceae bacterium]|nr:hypothetical protein [Hyphomonadaceae bacterium]